MKGFAVVLVCLFAAVQGRSTGSQASSPAALGENPWVVHTRVAITTSGLLNSCISTLINESWVLTSANCIRNNRFIWLRYGAVNVVRPELVLETNTVRVHPAFNPLTGQNDIALIRIARAIEFTDNIAPVALPASDAEIPASANLCGYGTSEGPGEILSCSNVAVETSENGFLVASTDASEFDIGAALVSDGVQYGVLSSTNDGESVFINVASYVDWIQSTAQLTGDVVMEEDIIV